jgi:hypothetical protein
MPYWHAVRADGGHIMEARYGDPALNTLTLRADAGGEGGPLEDTLGEGGPQTGGDDADEVEVEVEGDGADAPAGGDDAEGTGDAEQPATGDEAEGTDEKVE